MGSVHVACTSRVLFVHKSNIVNPYTFSLYIPRPLWNSVFSEAQNRLKETESTRCRLGSPGWIARKQGPAHGKIAKPPPRPKRKERKEESEMSTAEETKETREQKIRKACLALIDKAGKDLDKQSQQAIKCINEGQIRHLIHWDIDRLLWADIEWDLLRGLTNRLSASVDGDLVDWVEDFQESLSRRLVGNPYHGGSSSEMVNHREAVELQVYSVLYSKIEEILKYS
jgi:hypothetical protein